MNREVHVRICEGRGESHPPATRRSPVGPVAPWWRGPICRLAIVTVRGARTGVADRCRSSSDLGTQLGEADRLTIVVAGGEDLHSDREPAVVEADRCGHDGQSG